MVWVKELIEALYRSKKFFFDDLEVKVMPELLAVALVGYAALRKPAGGGEAEAIKEEMKAVCEKTGARAIVEVNKNPSLRFGKEMGHLFSITQRFGSRKEKQKDIEAMKRAKMISFHTFPVRGEWLE